MMIKIILRILFILSVCGVMGGCSRIEFVQYEQPGEPDTVNYWHHATLNGMIELSEPFNMQKACKQAAWNKVTTEHTVLNWLAEAAVPSYRLLLLYSAWTIKLECYKKNI